MNEKEGEGFRRKMRGVDSRLKAAIDESLLEFKAAYLELKPSLKDEIKASLLRLWEVRQGMPQTSPLSFSIELTVCLQTGEEEFFEAKLSPIGLLKAFEAWDRGELYAPTSLAELVG
jgi:hypothetical protein